MKRIAVIFAVFLSVSANAFVHQNVGLIKGDCLASVTPLHKEYSELFSMKPNQMNHLQDIVITSAILEVTANGTDVKRQNEIIVNFIHELADQVHSGKVRTQVLEDLRQYASELRQKSVEIYYPLWKSLVFQKHLARMKKYLKTEFAITSGEVSIPQTEELLSDKDVILHGIAELPSDRKARLNELEEISIEIGTRAVWFHGGAIYDELWRRSVRLRAEMSGESLLASLCLDEYSEYLIDKVQKLALVEHEYLKKRKYSEADTQERFQACADNFKKHLGQFQNTFNK